MSGQPVANRPIYPPMPTCRPSQGSRPREQLSAHWDPCLFNRMVPRRGPETRKDDTPRLELFAGRGRALLGDIRGPDGECATAGEFPLFKWVLAWAEQHLGETSDKVFHFTKHGAPHPTFSYSGEIREDASFRTACDDLLHVGIREVDIFIPSRTERGVQPVANIEHNRREQNKRAASVTLPTPFRVKRTKRNLLPGSATHDPPDAVAPARSIEQGHAQAEKKEQKEKEKAEKEKKKAKKEKKKAEKKKAEKKKAEKKKAEKKKKRAEKKAKREACVFTLRIVVDSRG
ncbi:hypothetical protein OPT61_g6294 [Boeremia exigua]|uniref:Uncharacterized protein n=1 Tax=Boeremia exigua TaxID=749465 RepID=A0ACC2I767_9PLEO|nr:hypothetical protein OPT61_g6294 [Boeremia exigua]